MFFNEPVSTREWSSDPVPLCMMSSGTLCTIFAAVCGTNWMKQHKHSYCGICDITGMIYKAGEDAKYKSSLTYQDPSNRPGWCLTVCILPEVYWGLSQRTWLWSSGYGETLLEKETMNSQRAPVITRFVFNAFFLELERSSENVC